MNPTNIPWCDLTWNPITGCTKGCPWCYARAIAARFGKPGGCYYDRQHTGSSATEAFPGATFPDGFRPTTYPHRLDEPLRRKKPATIFLGSMGDLFDPAFPDEFRDRVFATVAAAPQHTFMVLTKRAKEMGRYVLQLVNHAQSCADIRETTNTRPRWPLPNLWIGVTVTNQADADERIPLLLDTHAAHRFVSCEPLFGPVDLGQWLNEGTEHEHIRTGVLCGNSAGHVLDRHDGENMAACSTSGQPSGESVSASCGHEKNSRNRRVARLPEGAVHSSERRTDVGLLSSACLDICEQGHDSRAHGNQPPQWGAEGQQAGESGASDAAGKHTSCRTSARQTGQEGAAGREEHQREVDPRAGARSAGIMGGPRYDDGRDGPSLWGQLPDHPGCRSSSLLESSSVALDLVIVGGKTPGKPLHEQGCTDELCADCPDYDEDCGLIALRSLRDQCEAAGTPLHYKHGGTNPPLDGVVYDWRPS